MIAGVLFAFGLFGFISYFMQRSEKHGNWSPLEAVGVTIFIYFAGQITGGLLAYAIAALVGYDRAATADWIEKSTIGQFVTISLIEAISVALLYAFLKRRGANWRSIGLGGQLKLRDVGYALGGYAVYFVLYIIAIVVVSKLWPGFNTEQRQEIGFESARGIQLGLVFVSLVLLPPIVEEILMRGFLYSSLRRKITRFHATVITSALFAVAHLQAGSGAALLWVAAVDTFVLSVVLIHLREKTGKLWAPMGLHGLKNLVAFMSIFVFHLAK